MADGAVAILAALAGGFLTGGVALLQARSQRRFEILKTREDRTWGDLKTEQERDHQAAVKHREVLLAVYTRYQLAADRLENAIRELSSATRDGSAENHLGVCEAAQNEYDQSCQVLTLLAPMGTVTSVLAQRRLLTSFVPDAFQGTYDHQAHVEAITAMAAPVLDAMRLDLGTTSTSS